MVTWWNKFNQLESSLIAMVQRLLRHHILLAPFRVIPKVSCHFFIGTSMTSFHGAKVHRYHPVSSGIYTVCMISKFSSIFKQFKLCFEVSWYGRHVLIRCFPSANLLKAWLAWRRQEAPVKGPCSPPRRPSIKAMYSLLHSVRTSCK